MTQPKNLNVSNHPIQGWYYNLEEKGWYHQHKKGIWPFRKEYYVRAGLLGWCSKCHKRVPQELMNLIMKPLSWSNAPMSPAEAGSRLIGTSGAGRDEKSTTNITKERGGDNKDV